jgi:hypothetical protein
MPSSRRMALATALISTITLCMKQWLMYLMYVGPPLLDEPVDQVDELSNDEEEAFEGLLSMENAGHHLYDHSLQCRL